MERRYLFFHLVKSGSELQPLSHQVTKVTFPGSKAALNKAENSPTFNIEVKYAPISSHFPYKFSRNDTELRKGTLHYT